MAQDERPFEPRDFTTKDSGKREEFSTGMVRDTQDDKPRYDLIDGAFLKRWAELMARGAKKYGENNWKKAGTSEELSRFRASAIRHLFQWLDGDKTEDHAAAVAFNLAGAEMVEEKLKNSPCFSRPKCGTFCTGKCVEDMRGVSEEGLPF
jgi:Domain of unknown function (DUF5664)